MPRPSDLHRRLTAAGGPVAVLALVAIGALPGWEMHRVWSGDRAVPLAAGAAVVAAACSVLTTAAGRRFLVAATVSVVAFVVYGAEVVGARTTTYGVPSGTTIHTFADGIVHGVADLLSTSLPADPDPGLLLPMVVLVWAAVAIGVELALRHRWVAAPLLPALVALVVAAALSVGAAPGAGPTGAAFVVLAAVVLAGRWRAHGAAPASATSAGVGLGAEDPARSPLVRSSAAAPGARWLGVVPLAAVLAVIGAGVGPSLTFGRDHHPLDLRSARRLPASSVTAISPLDAVSGYLHHADQLLFTVRAPAPSDWALTTLDRFDGFDWTSSGSYVVTGSEVPAVQPPPVAPVTRSTLRQQVHLDGLAGPWLPAAARARTVTGVRVRVDPDDGGLLVAGRSPAGATYQVESTIAAPDPIALENAAVASDPSARADTALPGGLPPILAQTAQVATAGATSALSRALLLERYLRGNYRTDARAPGGHSYGRLVEFLSVDRVGTSEQFATAFATLGRVAGLPTRVVVGFGPGDDGSTPGTYRVTGSDALVWPEVDFAGIGWVAFDPTPTAVSSRDLPLGGSRQGAGSFVLSPPTHATVTNPATVPPTPAVPPVVRRGEGTGTFAVVVVVAIVGLALIGLSALAVYGRRRQIRRRRRHHPAPRQRIIAAWDATRRRLDELCGPLPPAATVADLVALSERHDRAAGHALAGLYRSVNQALFDTSEPSGAEADRAWKAYDAFAERAGRGSWSRRLCPAPLRDQAKKGRDDGAS